MMRVKTHLLSDSMLSECHIDSYANYGSMKTT